MTTGKTRTAVSITATTLLVILIPAGLNYVPPLLAQSTETGEDTSSASQDYQEFQSCLSDAEVDGTVSEQQIRDCFAPIYNTGTGTANDDTTTSSDSPTSGSDEVENGSNEESGGSE